MRLRPHRRNLVVWSQSADRDGGPRVTRARTIRRRMRIGVLLTIVTVMGPVRAARIRWRLLLAGAALTVVGVTLRGSPAGAILLPGLLFLVSALLVPAAPRAERLRRSELERELATYATPAQRRDLEAMLDQYPDRITREVRDILTREARAGANPRIPGCGRV